MLLLWSVKIEYRQKKRKSTVQNIIKHDEMTDENKKAAQQRKTKKEK